MFLTRSLSIKTNGKGFVYKFKLIMRNLTCSLENQRWMILFTEWFEIQREFATEKCRHQNYTNFFRNFICQRENATAIFKTKIRYSDTSPLNGHFKSPPFLKPFFSFSIIRDSQFHDANTSLSNFLKALSTRGQITPTMQKQPLTKEVVPKL